MGWSNSIIFKNKSFVNDIYKYFILYLWVDKHNSSYACFYFILFVSSKFIQIIFIYSHIILYQSPKIIKYSHACQTVSSDNPNSNIPVSLSSGFRDRQFPHSHLTLSQRRAATVPHSSLQRRQPSLLLLPQIYSSVHFRFNLITDRTGFLLTPQPALPYSATGVDGTISIAFTVAAYSQTHPPQQWLFFRERFFFCSCSRSRSRLCYRHRHLIPYKNKKKKSSGRSCSWSPCPIAKCSLISTSKAKPLSPIPSPVTTTSSPNLFLNWSVSTSFSLFPCCIFFSIFYIFKKEKRKKRKKSQFNPYFYVIFVERLHLDLDMSHWSCWNLPRDVNIL